MIYVLSNKKYCRKAYWLLRGLEKYIDVKALQLNQIGQINNKDCVIISHSSMFLNLPEGLLQKNLINLDTINLGFLPYKDVQKILVNEMEIVNTPKIVNDWVEIPTMKKPAYGTGGNGIIFSGTGQKSEEGFFVEEFIPPEMTVRVLVVDGKIVAIYNRIGNEKVLNGRNAEKIEILLLKNFPKLSEIVNKIVDKYKIEYAGFDFIKSKDNNKWYFLECNLSPVFFYYMQSGGHNVFSNIATMCKNKMK